MRGNSIISSLFLVILLTTLTSSGLAVLMDFNSVSVSNNSAKMIEWYNAIGITQSQYYIDFENTADGTNINNAPLFPNLVISVSTGGAYIRSNKNYFGASDPGPAGSTRALALTDSQILTLTFATPVDYISFFDIDISDLAYGTVYFSNGTSQRFDEGNESNYGSGNSATFYGLFDNERKISSITFRDTGGEGEFGIDEIRYGIIPEPSTLAILCFGALAFIKSKRKV
ncbi:MAG: PEP-CTERM sorting domain-containing protein [Phycisphaerales bacterium]